MGDVKLLVGVANLLDDLARIGQFVGFGGAIRAQFRHRFGNSIQSARLIDGPLQFYKSLPLKKRWEQPLGQNRFKSTTNVLGDPYLVFQVSLTAGPVLLRDPPVAT